MRYPFSLKTSTGVSLGCTDPLTPPVLAGDRWTPRPTAGDVLTADDGSRYLLLEVEPNRHRDLIQYYRLGLIALKHAIELQRLIGDNFSTYASSPCHLHRSTTKEEHSQDRSRSITRLDIWLPPTPVIGHNDRMVLGGQAYRVIDSEHLPNISRIIAVTDYR